MDSLENVNSLCDIDSRDEAGDLDSIDDVNSLGGRVGNRLLILIFIRIVYSKKLALYYRYT